MKNFTLLAFVFLLVSSCAKEEMTPLVVESPDGITRLYVKVTFYDETFDHGCGEGEVVPVTNAEAFLYVNDTEIADGKVKVMSAQSNENGLVKFENLENSEFDMEVKSVHGTKNEKVVVPSGRTTRIEVRY